jgi:hypothetical protein
MRKFTLALVVVVAALVAALPAAAATTFSYQATYVEPFGCAPGTSCGTASISHLGHSDTVVVFNACGLGCHIRTVTFEDGSTLVIRIEDQPSGFSSPGNSGTHGAICFPGYAGNPQFLNITETIVGGTGSFAGATGSGTGTVTLHDCVAIVKTSGTITLP